MSHIGSEMITLHNNRTVSHTLLHSTFLLFYHLWTNWTTLKVYCKLLPTLNFSIKSFTPPPPPKNLKQPCPHPLFFPFSSLHIFNDRSPSQESNSVYNHTSDKKYWTTAKHESDLSITSHAIMKSCCQLIKDISVSEKTFAITLKRQCNI